MRCWDWHAFRRGPGGCIRKWRPSRLDADRAGPGVESAPLPSLPKEIRMRRRLVVLLAAVAWFTPALAETPADRWNLSEIYASVAAWSADAEKLDAQMKEFAGCKGHLGDGVARFRKCLDLQADMTK